LSEAPVAVGVLGSEDPVEETSVAGAAAPVVSPVAAPPAAVASPVVVSVDVVVASVDVVVESVEDVSVGGVVVVVVVVVVSGEGDAADASDPAGDESVAPTLVPVDAAAAGVLAAGVSTGSTIPAPGAVGVWCCLLNLLACRF